MHYKCLKVRFFDQNMEQYYIHQYISEYIISEILLILKFGLDIPSRHPLRIDFMVTHG